MYRRFAFEGQVHTSLDCVPLAVRRRLDRAALKIPLAGWQALTRAERLALCHLPVDTDEDLAVYREVMQAFAARAGVELTPLPPVSPSAWAADRVPEIVARRARDLGVHVDLETWSRLDEEERYAVVKYAEKYADPKHGGTDKLPLLLEELGIANARAPGAGA